MKTNFNEANNRFSARSNDKFGRALFLAATTLSLFGGSVLLFIVCINVLSIFGRVFFSTPLMGDFELVEMGCAIAIFSFLPLCQLKNGNVIVDFFSLRFPVWLKNFLDSLSSLLFAFVAAFFTWRMVYGTSDMFHYNEQTMLLKLPVWLAFIPGVFSFFLLFLVCIYTFFISIKFYKTRK